VGNYLVNTIVTFLHTSVTSLPTIPKWTDDVKQYASVSRNVYHPVTNAYLARTVGMTEQSNTADFINLLVTELRKINVCHYRCNGGACNY
jgi:hypothetical protein